MTKDAQDHAKLTERQLHILTALIRTYTQRPEPISSKQLVDENETLGVSSATVRNELAVLEQLGMIRAPHTSAGRIPTEEGYRYFVQRMLQEDKTLSLGEQKSLRLEFEQATRDIQSWLHTAAGILAKRTQAAALVTEPRSRMPLFKHLQLINTHGHLVLMVLVLEGGEITQQMLALAEEVSQEDLTRLAAQLNNQIAEQTAEQVRQRARTTADTLTQEVMELVADALDEAAQGGSYVIHSTGFSDILPEFTEGGAQQALRILEKSTLLTPLLSDVIGNENAPVQVMVGGDGQFEDMSHISIVMGRYGTRDFAGAISVLGPTRMRYGRAISTVRYMATLMSAMIQDVYGQK